MMYFSDSNERYESDRIDTDNADNVTSLDVNGDKAHGKTRNNEFIPD